MPIAKSGPYLYYSVGGAGGAARRGVLIVVDPCTKPTSSTVHVEMREAPITLSQTTVPCGNVTFVVTNAGSEVHNLDLFQTNPPRTILHGSPLDPGQTRSFAAHLTVKGSVNYLCGQPEHGEEYGEVGFLTAT